MVTHEGLFTKSELKPSNGYGEGERIEVGPDNLEFVQLSAVHELPQYRQSYDRDALDELATSIVIDEDTVRRGAIEGDYDMITTGLDLGTPLIVNRLDKAHLDKYLQEHADHYQITAEHIPLDGRDMVDVIGSGHRRRRALELIAKRFDFDPDRFYVQTAVYHNLSFEEMLGKQFRENISERPPRLDEAASIARYYGQQVRAGKEPTYKSVAQFYCVDDRVVSRALAFATLPEEVRQYAERDILPFNLVARFSQLADAYGLVYATKESPGETREEYVKNELLVMANKLATHRQDGKPVKKLDETLSATIESVKVRANGVQEGLFFLEEEPSAQRRKRAVSETARRAIALLQMLSVQGELTDEQKTLLQTLADDARAIAAEIHQPTLLDRQD